MICIQTNSKHSVIFHSSLKNNPPPTDEPIVGSSKLVNRHLHNLRIVSECFFMMSGFSEEHRGHLAIVAALFHFLHCCRGDVGYSCLVCILLIF